MPHPFFHYNFQLFLPLLTLSVSVTVYSLFTDHVFAHCIRKEQELDEIGSSNSIGWFFYAFQIKLQLVVDCFTLVKWPLPV